MRITHLPASTRRRVPWKNGRGVTTEICSDAVGADGPWSWRVSIADVPEVGPFSAFPGVDRHILCLSGPGMRILIDGVWRVVPREGEGLVFAGEAAVSGEPGGSGVRDVNLMVARERWRGWLGTTDRGTQVSLAPGSHTVLLAEHGDVELRLETERVFVPGGSSVLVRDVETPLMAEVLGGAIMAVLNGTA